MLRSIPGLLLASLLLASCGTMQQAAQVRDDVYFLPSMAPAPSLTASTEPIPVEEPTKPADDYYDPNSAAAADGSGGYYDATYNDPYYYNYGRFGFNANMGYQSGWNGPGWGMGMGWNTGIGWNYGMSMGWGTPYYGGWGNPYYGSGWGNPYYGWNDPWYGGGYGYGNYYGPYGSCTCCYSPIIIAGSGNMVVGHRPSVSGGGGTGVPGAGGQPRASFRDPVRLAPSGVDQGSFSGTPSRSTANPTRNTGRLDNGTTRPAHRETGGGNGTREHRGGFEQSGGSSPSRSGGSMGNSGGNSGGGSRSGGGGRPR